MRKGKTKGFSAVCVLSTYLCMHNKITLKKGMNDNINNNVHVQCKRNLLNILPAANCQVCITCRELDFSLHF